MSSDRQDAIGVFTAIHGTVSVAHLDASKPIAAALQGEVLFRDAIETQNESRTKVLLYDDSLLTVGEQVVSRFPWKLASPGIWLEK